MTPVEYYQKQLESDLILKDPQQEQVIKQLQLIYDQVLSYNPSGGFLQKLTAKKPQIKGLYLWGEVGIGKTFLMDSFYYCLPFQNKLRIHFHQFMKMIHEQLQQLKGESNPIIKIAKKIAKENLVICFDELVVTDITDAMILAGLFETLYQEKTCILFTSNTPPDNLYINGIQRESFLPAIELIKKHSDVVHLSSREDYRFKNYQENNYYFIPLGHESDAKLESHFAKIADKNISETGVVRILDRDIKYKKKAKKVIWFDFMAICGIPRSQHDYIDITKQFDTIIVSDVKVIQPEQNDLARSFINLIDVLYDANKQLIISAEKPIEQIYYCGRMLFEFARTRSRLVEMQTESWAEKIK